MLNLNREITPEVFAHDPERIFWDSPEGHVAKRKYYAERDELKRLYHVQEEAKAKAAFLREETRKEQIPFSEAIALEICKRVSAGQFLIAICQDEHMPTVRSVIEWKKYHSDFKTLYDEAIRDRLDIFEDELVTIADDGSADIKTVTKGNKTTKVLDGEVISHAKLRVDVRKAHLKAYRPERWAEQSTLNVNNNNSDDPANMTTDEIERRLAELEAKECSVKAA
jgi:hypothetical protein